METKTRYLLILIFVGSLIFLYNLGAKDLWEPDETRYAVVAREMKETGNWMVPHLNGAIYSEKPPLFFWLVNLSTSLLGDNEAANRLPSALAGLITVLLTFLFGARLFGARTGFLSGLVLASGFFLSLISRWMILDSLFTLFFLLALYFFYEGYKNVERRRVHYLLVGTFIGFGVLTKGPIAFLPIPILLILGFLNKDAKKVWNLDLLWGVLLSLALLSAWLIPACWTGGHDYTRRILIEQSVGRVIATTRHSHPQSFLFYLIRFPAEFLPWTLFIPAAVALQLNKPKEERGSFLFISVWFLLIFFFFSLLKGKKDNYILPLYPAASILVGRWLDSFVRTPEARESVRMRLLNPVALAAFFFLGLWLARLLSPLEWFPQAVHPHLSLLDWPLSLAAIGGILSLGFLFKRWLRLSLLPLVVALILAQMYFAVAILPRLNEFVSNKSFSRKILTAVARGDELKFWKCEPTGIPYYTGRSIEQIRGRGRLVEFLSSSRPVFLVVEEEDVSALRSSTANQPLHQVFREQAGRRMMYLFSNQATPNHAQADGDNDTKMKEDHRTPGFVQTMSRLARRWLFLAGEQKETHVEQK
jgi:4-amino-4-deoxy-L-arabinose transferase-like glycosyltransferase